MITDRRRGRHRREGGRHAARPASRADRARHARPPELTASDVAARAAGVTAGVALATMALPPAASAEPADGWGPIIECESNGRNIENQSDPSSTASGYFQITNGTWRAHGGTEFASRAIHASRAEQEIVANRIHKRRGSLADWNASRSCWDDEIGSEAYVSGGTSGGGGGSARAEAEVEVEVEAEANVAIVDERSSDGTGRYTCTNEKLYFEACDPHNLGEIVNYPRFRSAPRVQAEAEANASADVHVVVRGDTLAKIAARAGVSWRVLYEQNRSVVGGDPNLIFPGQRLNLP